MDPSRISLHPLPQLRLVQDPTIRHLCCRCRHRHAFLCLPATTLFARVLDTGLWGVRVEWVVSVRHAKYLLPLRAFLPYLARSWLSLQPSCPPHCTQGLPPSRQEDKARASASTEGGRVPCLVLPRHSKQDGKKGWSPNQTSSRQASKQAGALCVQSLCVRASPRPNSETLHTRTPSQVLPQEPTRPFSSCLFGRRHLRRPCFKLPFFHVLSPHAAT